MNERGQYGNGDDDAVPPRRTGAGPIVALLAMTMAIYGFSPGARHWYRHGRLPPG